MYDSSKIKTVGRNVFGPKPEEGPKECKPEKPETLNPMMGPLEDLLS